MRSTQQFSITLPREMADQIEQKVKSGAYATVSEVMRDGVRALMERDAAIERWLREEVIESIREHEANPQRSIGADKVMDRVRKLARRGR
jgi:putative addiction module CopG family antidote